MASSSRVKRKLADMEGNPEDGAPPDPEADTLTELADLPDTMVALRFMLAQFPKLDQVRPFVLRTQLYSSVQDRTMVDRELEDLQHKKYIRLFKLNSGPDDFAILLMEDYTQRIQAAKSRLESKYTATITVVFDWFQENVVQYNTKASISNSHLVTLLSTSGKVTDEQVSALVNAGLLVRNITDMDEYWFSVPGFGMASKNITQGRKELLQFLSKRKYKEIFLPLLEKRKLRNSFLGIRFHVRDLLGSSSIFSSQTTAGTLIKIK